MLFSSLGVYVPIPMNPSTSKGMVTYKTPVFPESIKAVPLVVSSASIIMAGIMKLFSIIIAYIIFIIVYFIKVKKEKKTKINTIVIWLIIAIILAIALYFGSIAVIKSDFLG